MSMVAPVTNEERSEAKNKNALAISRGLAMRAIGIVLRILSKISWLIRSPRMSVSTIPGATALTRIPLGPSSRAWMGLGAVFLAESRRGLKKYSVWRRSIAISRSFGRSVSGLMRYSIHKLHLLY